MIRANRSPRPLGGMGLAAVLLAAAAALPIAPSLAREDVAGEAEVNVEPPRAEVRDLVLTPTVESADLAPATVTFTEDGKGVVIVAAPDKDDAPGADPVLRKVYDARTGSTIEYRGADVRVVAGPTDDELAQTRAEVEKLSAALADAKARLRKLEVYEKDKLKVGKIKEKPAKEGDPSPRTTTVPLRLDVKRADDARLNKTKLNAEWFDKAGGEQERRLERLEQRLDKLDAVLDELREMRKQDRDREKELPKGPGTN